VIVCEVAAGEAEVEAEVASEDGLLAGEAVVPGVVVPEGISGVLGLLAGGVPDGSSDGVLRAAWLVPQELTLVL
jgi:hypothetical protein